MKKLIIKTFLVLWALCAIIPVQGQRPVQYDSPLREYNTAQELFEKHEFGSAQEYFQYVYEHTTDQQYDMKSTSYFYMGVCAAKLNHGNATFLLRDFITRYPIHTMVPEAHMYIGRSYYYQKQYKRALEYFNEIDERKVREEDLAEYYFKKGYCALYAGEKDDAKYLFRQAKEHPGQYQQKATYYLAHIAYEDGQYESALAGFNELKDVKEYAKSVPFYIAQINFLQGDYETVTATVPALIPQSTDQAELYRIVALSHYNLGNYRQAEEAFNEFLSLNKNSNALGRADHYAIGYTYYKNKKYTEAAAQLSQTTDSSDAIAQSSYYIIADCLLKQNKNKEAASYFLDASKTDYSPVIQEDAFYNYAKLQYENAGASFKSDAMSALEEYIERYPHTSRANELSGYMAAIYSSTKNYNEAIKAIERLDRNNRSPEILRSYQRCTHFRALELINEKKYKDAGKMLDKSLQTPMDPEMNLSNLFWKAEAAYRAENYTDAYNAFLLYNKSRGVTQNANYVMSLYSFGYTAMKNKKYREAQKSFEKFISLNNGEYASYQADAYARIADCYFMQKELGNAITYYEKCEQANGNNADYALYQKAICYGYQQNTSKKVSALEKFCKNYPKSSYIDDVKYELAGIYHSQNQHTLAINSYTAFIHDYPKSPYVSKAYNKLAQAYLNAQQTDKAIETFKYVVDKYPGSKESKDALSNLEDIYTELGETSAFFEYIQSKGKENFNATPEHQDSITYRAAESKFIKGEYEKAVEGFNKYISSFPNGLFIANAYYNRAQCHYDMRDYNAALADYEYIIQNFRTEYNEQATKRAATILYNQKEYARGLKYFKELRDNASNNANSTYACNGIMRCAFELENYKEALDGAKGYLDSPDADPDLTDDAKLIAGISSCKTRDYSAARKYLKPLALSGTGEISAEAAYYCALLEFNQKNYDACEKEITNILEAKYTSAHWIAATFILYGDLYLARGNSFQARHTYQSIVDNYDGEDLRAIARQRIDQLDSTPSNYPDTPGDENNDLNPNYDE